MRLDVAHVEQVGAFVGPRAFLHVEPAFGDAEVDDVQLRFRPWDAACQLRGREARIAHDGGCLPAQGREHDPGVGALVRPGPDKLGHRQVQRVVQGDDQFPTVEQRDVVVRAPEEVAVSWNPARHLPLLRERVDRGDAFGAGDVLGVGPRVFVHLPGIAQQVEVRLWVIADEVGQGVHQVAGDPGVAQHAEVDGDLHGVCSPESPGRAFARGASLPGGQGSRLR